MRKISTIAVISSLCLSSLFGCSSGEGEMSKKQEDEFKEGFKKGLQTDKMTPEQIKKMQEAIGGAGAPSAPK